MGTFTLLFFVFASAFSVGSAVGYVLWLLFQKLDEKRDRG